MIKDLAQVELLLRRYEQVSDDVHDFAGVQATELVKQIKNMKTLSTDDGTTALEMVGTWPWQEAANPITKAIVLKLGEQVEGLNNKTQTIL